jgi:carbonic anhydrase
MMGGYITLLCSSESQATPYRAPEVLRTGYENLNDSVELRSPGCTPEELDARHVGDPRAAVRADIDVLANNPFVPDQLAVTGIIYDTDTGRAELIERRAPLRPARPTSPSGVAA